MNKLYQVNIVERQQKSFLVSARTVEEALKLLKANLMTSSGVIELGETDTPKAEQIDEVFPVCIEENVMDKESKYYKE